MRHSSLLVAAAVACIAASPAFSQDSVSGTGSAPVTRDTDAVRAIAEGQARIDLVRNFARQVLGAERVAELTPEVLERLAGQIQPAVITGRSSQRVGQTFQTTLTASIDRAWFQNLLDAEGIRPWSGHVGGERLNIVVLVDEFIGPASDYSQPAEIVTEYDRDSGSSFNDDSVTAYSDRGQSGSSSSYSQGSTSRGASAGSYRDGYGAGASRSASSRSSAAQARRSSASSHATSFIDRNDVEASTHDNVRFRQRVTYQSAASSGTGAAVMAGLTEGLLSHSVSTSNAVPMMSTLWPGEAPTFDGLQSSGRLDQFFRSAEERSSPFVMSGKLQVVHTGRHPGTGQAACGGSLDAQVYATGGSAQNVAATLVDGETAADSYEVCASRLARLLSQQAADRVGPQVQSYWRNQTRDRAQVVNAATSASDYTVVLRGGALTTAQQMNFLNALSSVPGVESHAFLNSSADQMNLQVRYAGAMPLHLAVYQQLQNDPAFANLEATAGPQQVVLCIGGC